MRFAETGPLRFVWALNAHARKQHLLTQHSLIEFNAMRCFLSEDERSGFAIKQDGELTCLFSNGLGIETAIEATIQGATKLDCFDTTTAQSLQTLPEFYRKVGWREVRRECFDMRRAPHYWPAHEGSPDVVWMVWP